MVWNICFPWICRWWNEQPRERREHHGQLGEEHASGTDEGISFLWQLTFHWHDAGQAGQASVLHYVWECHFRVQTPPHIDETGIKRLVHSRWRTRECPLSAWKNLFFPLDPTKRKKKHTKLLSFCSLINFIYYYSISSLTKYSFSGLMMQLVQMVFSPMTHANFFCQLCK